MTQYGLHSRNRPPEVRLMYSDRRCRVHTEILFLFQVSLKIYIQLAMIHFHGNGLTLLIIIEVSRSFHSANYL